MAKLIDWDVSTEKLSAQLDVNTDGEPSVSFEMFFAEALAEALKKGDAVEGVKVADFRFEGSKLKLTLDTDKDGEALLKLVIDLPEVFDEIKDSYFSKGE
jgi:uncharacterized protein (DUF169 family)